MALNTKALDEYVLLQFHPCPDYQNGRLRIQHLKTVNDPRVKSVRCSMLFGKEISVRDVEDGLVKPAILRIAGSERRARKTLADIQADSDNEVEVTQEKEASQKSLAAKRKLNQDTSRAKNVHTISQKLDAIKKHVPTGKIQSKDFIDCSTDEECELDPLLERLDKSIKETDQLKEQWHKRTQINIPEKNAIATPRKLTTFPWQLASQTSPCVATTRKSIPVIPSLGTSKKATFLQDGLGLKPTHMSTPFSGTKQIASSLAGSPTKKSSPVSPAKVRRHLSLTDIITETIGTETLVSCADNVNTNVTGQGSESVPKTVGQNIESEEVVFVPAENIQDENTFFDYSQTFELDLDKASKDTAETSGIGDSLREDDASLQSMTQTDQRPDKRTLDSNIVSDILSPIEGTSQPNQEFFETQQEAKSSRPRHVEAQEVGNQKRFVTSKGEVIDMKIAKLVIEPIQLEVYRKICFACCAVSYTCRPNALSYDTMSTCTINRDCPRYFPVHHTFKCSTGDELFTDSKVETSISKPDIGSTVGSSGSLYSLPSGISSESSTTFTPSDTSDSDVPRRTHKRRRRNVTSGYISKNPNFVPVCFSKEQRFSQKIYESTTDESAIDDQNPSTSRKAREASFERHLEGGNVRTLTEKIQEKLATANIEGNVAQALQDLIKENKRLSSQIQAMQHEDFMSGRKIELIPGTGVYVNKELIKRMTTYHNSPTRLARDLFRVLFSVEDLKTHSLLGRGRGTFRGARELPALHPTMRDAVIEYAITMFGFGEEVYLDHSHAKYKEFRRIRRDVVKSLGDMMRDIRKGRLQHLTDNWTKFAYLYQ